MCVKNLQSCKLLSENGPIPAAIIQLPNELVPLLLPKKDPVKIGQYWFSLAGIFA